MKTKAVIVIIGFCLGAAAVKLGLGIVLGLLAVLCIGLILISDYEKTTYILAFYVLLDYAIRTYATSVSTIWDEMLLIVMFLLWGVKFWIKRQKNISTPIDLPLFIFYAVSVFVLIVNSPDIKIGIEGFRAVIQFTIWFFVVVQLLKTVENVRKVLILVVFTGTLLALHGIYQFIVKVPMPSNWVDSAEANISVRVFSIVGSPNILGSLMTLISPLAVSIAMAESSRSKKIYYFLCAVLMVMCLVFTYSRGAWIGFAVALLAYVFAKDKRLIFPIIIIFVLAMVLVPSISSRISYMLSSEYVTSSMRAGRLTRWQTGWEMLLTKPVFGFGLGQFGGAVAMNNKIPGTYYMDNYFLKTAVEMGFVGLVAFVVTMYSVFAWSLRNFMQTTDKYYKEISLGLFSGLTGIIIHNFVENIFEVPVMTSYFWILVACTMVIWKSFNEKKKEGV